MVRDLHGAGIEVILDVVYNHTAEGNHMGPTLSHARHRQRGLLPARRRRPALLHGLHRHRELAQRPQPAHAAADHGLAAVLGHRDARRRLPVRPRLHAGPRVLRRRPAVGVLRPRPAGPGDQPGQAHRRAVGRRPGRLPGRQLPAAVDASGTASTATPCATSGAASRARSASSPPGSPAAPTSTRTTAAARTRRSTSSPRTTASRCTTSSPTTRSTTRPTARTATTARATTARGTAGSRARPTTPRCSALRARQQRNFIATLMLSPGRADAAARRRDGPHPARQQQRLLPGQPDRLGGLVAADENATCSSFTARRRRAAAPPTRCSADAGSSPGGRSRRAAPRATRPLPDIAWFTPPGEEMTEQDWDSGFGKCVTAFLNGEGISEADTRGERVTDDSFLLCFNAHYEDIERHAAGRGVRRSRGRSWSTRRPAR